MSIYLNVVSFINGKNKHKKQKKYNFNILISGGGERRSWQTMVQ